MKFIDVLQRLESYPPGKPRRPNWKKGDYLELDMVTGIIKRTDKKNDDYSIGYQIRANACSEPWIPRIEQFTDDEWELLEE